MFNDFFIHAGEVWVFVKYPCILPVYGYVDTRTPIRMTKNNYEMLEIIVDPIPAGELYRLDLNSYYHKTALVNVEITEKLEVLPEVGKGDKPNAGGECDCEPIDISGLATKEFVKTEIGKISIPEMPSIDHLATRKELVEMMKEKHVITGVPEGTIIDYRENEIRIMCPKDAIFNQQNPGEGGNANMYYMAMTTQAPEGAVAFNEGDKGVIAERNISLEGKKSKTIWLAMANLSGSIWNYFGKGSTAAKPIGWDYIIEWLDADGNIIETNCIRINLVNEECFGVSLFSAVKELANMFKFNTNGELEVTINGVKKVFIPKE